MLKMSDAWVAREHLRWLRRDASRWLRPDHARFRSAAECKAGFNPEQPRDEEGRWTDAGAEDEVEGVADPESPADEFSDAGRAKGHHFVARSIYRNLPLSPEAKAVFDNATTGPLQSGHGWSKEHEVYSKAVTEHFERFMNTNVVTPRRQ